MVTFFIQLIILRVYIKIVFNKIKANYEINFNRTFWLKNMVAKLKAFAKDKLEYNEDEKIIN